MPECKANIISTQTSNKLVWVQFCASVVITLGHSFNYINFFPQGSTELFAATIVLITTQWATNIVMPMFFVISGFLLFKGSVHGGGTACWYLSKIKSRVRSLLIPYLCWNTIWCAFFMCLGVMGLTSGNVDTSITLQNIMDGIFFRKYNEVFWYVQILMVFVLASPLFWQMLRNKRIGILSLGCFAMLALSSVPLISNFNSIYFFGLGAYIAIHHPAAINLRISKKHIGISVFLLTLALVWLDVINYSQKIPLFLARHIGMVAFWLVMDIVRDIPCKNYMRYSFFIYATHKPIQQIFNKIFQFLLPSSLAGHLINVYVGAALALLVIALAGIMLRRFCPKMFSILNGGRI